MCQIHLPLTTLNSPAPPHPPIQLGQPCITIIMQLANTAFMQSDHISHNPTSSHQYTFSYNFFCSVYVGRFPRHLKIHIAHIHQVYM